MSSKKAEKYLAIKIAKGYEILNRANNKKLTKTSKKIYLDEDDIGDDILSPYLSKLWVKRSCSLEGCDDKWVYINKIRHSQEYCNYDVQLKNLLKANFANSIDLHREFKKYCLVLIGKAYPDLKSLCDKQIKNLI